MILIADGKTDIFERFALQPAHLRIAPFERGAHGGTQMARGCHS
jgi:hypothetical protein